ncbi:hypothetical protein [Pantoea ananatis]|uniref:hypothetical protein n=1 Tax=Pantoea ananas TaxID=553 RepID=UPI001B30A67E|nr:hypothetical protein [Pantoea ananatis]
MLIGFVLIIISFLPVPVSEYIYPTLAACGHVKEELLKREPISQLECAEIRRQITV